MKAIQRQSDRFGGHQARGAPIAEQQEAQHLLELPLFLQMQAGQFQIDHQHLRVRFRSHDVARQLQRVHRREAAHEADDGALDGRRKTRVLHDVEVESRRGEPGAACHDQMGDRVAFRRDVERADRLTRQRQRRIAIQRHARAGGWKVAAPIEPLAVEDVIARLRSWREERIAMLDVGQIGHAVEQRAAPRIGQRGAGEVHELGVDVILRNRGADPVEPRLGQVVALSLTPCAWTQPGAGSFPRRSGTGHQLC